MSQSFAQFVPANSSRSAVGVSEDFAAAPRFNPANETTRSILHLEIRHSLQVHRRLAAGLALIGLALALIYLLDSWSIRTASSLNKFQPARSSSFEESSLHRVTAMRTRPEPWRIETTTRYEGLDPHVGRYFQSSVPIGDGPGFPGLAAATIPPWYSANSDVIRNALVLFLSFVFLGGAMAVVAHRADPRVYIACDVEQILGFPLMAQLPDFSEVANEITNEYLLRLASGIDRGFRDRGFRRYVFTGTGPQVGVTTAATRLKKVLETLGRAAVVADATGGLSLAENTQSEMVLVDAAPLADSEETERLVQSAHCTIVVIESGVTTRAQLRTVASILQRTKAPAVGFVLNRVRLAVADPEFRRSIREMGGRLRKQGQVADSQMLQTLEQAIEMGRASLDLDLPISPCQPAAKLPGKIAKNAALFNEILQADGPGATHHFESGRPNAVSGLQLVPRSHTKSANQAREEIPMPLAEIASQVDRLPPEPKAERNQAPLPAASGPNGNGTTSELANPVSEKTARVALPRLSELRSMRFSQALRDLDRAKHPASSSAGLEMLMSAIAPFEPMFSRSETASAKNEDSSDAASADFDLPASLRAFIAASDSGVSPEVKEGAAAKRAIGNGNHLHSDFNSPEPQPDSKSGGRREEEDESRPQENDARQRLSGPFEQPQILPSQRGQYKRKKS